MWATNRTSGLSMPMPNAIVATITTPSSRRNRSWRRRRVSPSRPARSRSETLRPGEAGVVGQCDDPLIGQPGGGLLDPPAREAVDDPRGARVVRAQEAQ